MVEKGLDHLKEEEEIYVSFLELETTFVSGE